MVNKFENSILAPQQIFAEQSGIKSNGTAVFRLFKIDFLIVAFCNLLKSFIELNFTEKQ